MSTMSVVVPQRRSPDQRRDVLAVDVARYGTGVLLDRIVSSPDTNRSRWPPRWATGGQVSTALRTTFAGHTGTAAAVACTMLDGRPIAVTASSDGTARIWDLTTNTSIGDPAHRPSQDGEGDGVRPARRLTRRPHRWLR